MTLPPEVLLDRFLKSDQRSQADRAVYLGKQDLQALAPSFGSFLVEVQDAINTALRKRGNTFETGQQHTYHFDYVNATRPNALAFEHEGYAFIVVTMPLVRALWRMSEELSKSDAVTEVFRVITTDEVREAILAVLFITQLTFIVCHEFAHHDRGHFALGGAVTDLWKEMPTADAVGSLKDQAREIDADGWAVYLVLSHLIIGDRRDSTCAALGFKAVPDHVVDQVLLSSFILAIAAVLFVFPPSAFDDRTLYRLTHPPQAARMNVIMLRVRTWCLQNRPTLGEWMTLGRFQALMRSAQWATSGLVGVRDWSKQTAFFQTQAGSEYFRRLHENVISLAGDNGLPAKQNFALADAAHEFY